MINALIEDGIAENVPYMLSDRRLAYVRASTTKVEIVLEVRPSSNSHGWVLDVWTSRAGANGSAIVRDKIENGTDVAEAVEAFLAARRKLFARG